MSPFRLRSVVLSLSTLATAVHAQGIPSVQLDNGVFTGTTTGNVSKFLSIPYAQPPVGDLRLRLPVANDAYNGTYNATAFGAACPQQPGTLPLPPGLGNDILQGLLNASQQGSTLSSEDCLTINVVVPAGTPPGAKLPVAVWIYGGGFMTGDASPYDGGVIVQRSIDLREPVVYVSLNYRLSAFGFLSSEEIRKAGVANLGLHDQRQALRWIQKYISAFGGDPSRVIIWGESAGSISAALHMLWNGGDTEGLFHGAFMQSGSPLPLGNSLRGQANYDSIVAQTGCGDAPDMLQCLRGVPYDKFKRAVDQTPGLLLPESLMSTYFPRPDKSSLPDVSQKLLLAGKVANIPIVSGDCDDEGTVTALLVTNFTTEDQLRAYITAPYLFPNISSGELDQLLEAYPDTVAEGSPYGTGEENALTPQYKRIASLQGDLVFQGPRRLFLKTLADRQPVWSFLSKRGKSTAIIGSAHTSDVFLNVYAPADMTDFLINFVNHLDPNGQNGSKIAWPRYTKESPQLMTFLDGSEPLSITEDNYREESIALVQKLSLEHPL
ncbi:carotenoid ester lipase precursor [Trametes elegans]|nr:carotenoid ester lipase precursor [Trametes elegans]